jgi:hypothetical protein
VPLFNAVKIYGKAVAEVLEPGERLLAMGMFHPNLGGDTSGFERTDDEARPGDGAGSSGRLVEGVDWTGVQYNKDRVDRIVGGSTGSGAVGSIAGRMWRAMRETVSGQLEWAVTDQRLLLLQKTAHNPAEFAIHFAVRRADIGGVRRRAKILFQWGRCEVAFVDGSRLAMTISMVDIGAARNFVGALSRAR